MFESEAFQYWLKNWNMLVKPAIGATLRMVIATMILAFFFGFMLAIVLVITRPYGLHPNKRVYKVLNFIVNTCRSFPTREKM